MKLLALEQGIIAHGVVVMLPQGLHAVTNVAKPRSQFRRFFRTSTTRGRRDLLDCHQANAG